MTITLDMIKAEQEKVNKLIELFATQTVHTILFPTTEIKLRQDEHYAGIITSAGGAPNYHLVLLPGETKDVEHGEATTWAKAVGGELPTRREQALLYANLKDEFRSCYYWSSERRANGSSYAWDQNYHNSYQDYNHESSRFSARAIRRVIILPFSNMVA